MKCKKIIYKMPYNKTPNIILGIIEKEDHNTITVRTAKNLHIIKREFIDLITDTNQEFRREENGD